MYKQLKPSDINFFLDEKGKRIFLQITKVKGNKKKETLIILNVSMWREKDLDKNQKTEMDS